MKFANLINRCMCHVFPVAIGYAPRSVHSWARLVELFRNQREFLEWSDGVELLRREVSHDWSKQ